MSEEVFKRYSAYYDLLYRDKDYLAEADYVGKTLRGVAKADTVLELGSGTGRHGRLLANKGFNVFGIERSEFMVKLAHESKNEENASGFFDCAVGDIKAVELDRTFDAVISLFHVVSYQISNSDALQTFATAAKHLAAGGIFFFDVWHGPAVLTERPSMRVKRVEDDAIKLTRIAEPELNTSASLVTVRYTIFVESKKDGVSTSFQEEHRMRYFFPLEMELIARQSGFEIVRSEEFLSGHAPSDRTWGVGYLFRKI